jgi:hypothetical protein
MTVAKFTFKAEAYKTKDNKKFIFKMNGHKYLLTTATAGDYIYSGIRSNYVVLEVTEDKAAK